MIMKEYEKFLIERENEFQKSISKLAKIKEYRKNSIKQIAEKIGLSTANIRQTIRKYNEIENLLRCTYKKEYLLNDDEIENSKQIRLIAKMIKDTYELPILPLLTDKDLVNIYGVPTAIVDKYIAIILGNKSKNEYAEMLSDEWKNVIKNETAQPQ